MRNAELWAHQWETNLVFASTSRTKAHVQVRDRVCVAHELARGNLVGWAEFTDTLLNQRAGTSPMLRQMVESLTQSVRNSTVINIRMMQNLVKQRSFLQIKNSMPKA